MAGAARKRSQTPQRLILDSGAVIALAAALRAGLPGSTTRYEARGFCCSWQVG
jgi:hypothetical protein